MSVLIEHAIFHSRSSRTNANCTVLSAFNQRKFRIVNKENHKEVIFDLDFADDAIIARCIKTGRLMECDEKNCLIVDSTHKFKPVYLETKSCSAKTAMSKINEISKKWELIKSAEELLFNCSKGENEYCQKEYNGNAACKIPLKDVADTLRWYNFTDRQINSTLYSGNDQNTIDLDLKTFEGKFKEAGFDEDYDEITRPLGTGAPVPRKRKNGRIAEILGSSRMNSNNSNNTVQEDKIIFRSFKGLAADAKKYPLIETFSKPETILSNLRDSVKHQQPNSKQLQVGQNSLRASKISTSSKNAQPTSETSYSSSSAFNNSILDNKTWSSGMNFRQNFRRMLSSKNQQPSFQKCVSEQPGNEQILPSDYYRHPLSEYIIASSHNTYSAFKNVGPSF